MELKDILLGYVAKQYGITEKAAAELLYISEEEGKSPVLKDDALTVLLDRDKERVRTVREEAEGDKTKTYDRAFGDAKRTVLEKVEKRLAEKYGIEDEGLKLDDLVEAIASKQAATPAEGGLTDDAVKRHPAYLALEREAEKQVSDLTAAHEGELTKIKEEQARAETWTSAETLILDTFDGLRPVLPSDSAKAANQRKDFANRYQRYELKAQEGGDFLVIENGKRLEDDHGNALYLSKLVASDADKFYDFAKQDPKGSAGNGGGDDGVVGSVKAPASEEEYNSAIFEATSQEERDAIDAAYEAAKS